MNPAFDTTSRCSLIYCPHEAIRYKFFVQEKFSRASWIAPASIDPPRQPRHAARMKPETTDVSPAWAAVWIVAAACIVRLVLAAWTGLGIDESYMVAASNQFAASYFDHPLASWWLELGSRWLFGNAAPIVVRLPFIALSAVSSWLLYGLTHRLYGARAAFWAVAAYNISPVFSLAFGCWVLPDGPLDAALLAAAYALSRALGIAGHDTRPERRWWGVAGLCAGLALLSKYNAALTLTGAVLLLLTDPVSCVHLRTWRPWAAGLLAAVMFLPVICWNFSHDWQSFHYQGGRAAGLRLHFFAPFSIWGGEALFLLPWLWLPLVALLIAAIQRGPGERRGWFLAMLGVIPVVLFAVIGIWSSTRILYHWAAPGYLMLFPLLGNWAARLGTRAAWWRNIAAGVSAALLAGAALLITAEVGFAIVPGLNRFSPPGKSPLLQVVDWNSVRDELAARGDLNNPKLAVATLRWYDAGKIGYALRGTLPVTVFGPEPHQFGISTPPASLIGRDVLIMAMPGDVSTITAQYAPDFKSISPAPALTVTDHGATLLVIPMLLGTDLLKAP
jgi:4-amino-4-deoxy-L-arabinose transferase-like glycosyltransferase